MSMKKLVQHNIKEINDLSSKDQQIKKLKNLCRKVAREMDQLFDAYDGIFRAYKQAEYDKQSLENEIQTVADIIQPRLRRDEIDE